MRRASGTGSSSTSRRCRASRTGPTPRRRRRSRIDRETHQRDLFERDRETQLSRERTRLLCRRATSASTVQPVRPDQVSATQRVSADRSRHPRTQPHPENYFAEVEQAAPTAANIVPAAAACSPGQDAAGAYLLTRTRIAIGSASTPSSFRSTSRAARCTRLSRRCAALGRRRIAGCLLRAEFVRRPGAGREVQGAAAQAPPASQPTATTTATVTTTIVRPANCSA